MPITPPDPFQIAAALLDQLAQIEALLAAYPREPAYPLAVDHVRQAIAALESVPKSAT